MTRTPLHRIATRRPVARRDFLAGFGAAGLAVAFASACRSASPLAGATSEAPGTGTTSPSASGAGSSTVASGPTGVVAGAETAVTTMPAGTNPFDDYAYENAATGTRVRIWVDGDTRYIEANGLPDHATGTFPNAHNPNTISAQHYAFQVPASPAQTGVSTANGVLDIFGIAINGVPFDPGAAGFWNDDFGSGWQVEPLSPAIDLGEDSSNAHVQATGAYHYHGIPEGMLTAEDGAPQSAAVHSPLVGFAADGFPIYVRYLYADPAEAGSNIALLRSSYQLKQGIRPSAADGPGGAYDGTYVADYEWVSTVGDLDRNNGRFGVTPEYPDGTYYYVLTDGFPFVPRRFAGTPDSGFSRGVPAGSGARAAGGPPPGGPLPRR
jgi:hypothetical protein